MVLEFQPIQKEFYGIDFNRDKRWFCHKKIINFKNELSIIRKSMNFNGIPFFLNIPNNKIHL